MLVRIFSMKWVLVKNTLFRFVCLFVFECVSPTIHIIWRRNLVSSVGLVELGIESQPLVYKASGLSITQWLLLLHLGNSNIHIKHVLMEKHCICLKLLYVILSDKAK